MARSLAIFAVLAVLGTSSAAEACASCGAGDPTLTLAGTEQPFAGRLRVSLSGMSSGTTSPTEQMAERRLALGVAWAPVSWIMLSASAPLVLRSAETTSLEHDTSVAPGDLDLRARFVVLRDRPMSPTHLVTLQIGTRIPLAPSLADAQGPLDDGAQTASRTVTPLVGLQWSVYAAPFSLQTYVLASIPTRGGDGLADAIEIRAASLAIVQVVPALSIVAGPETRVRIDQSAAGEGGQVLFGTFGAMLAIGDVTPYVLIRVPVVSAFDDAHVELTSIELGATLDV